MIRPPGRGVAFSDRSQGDLRADSAARADFSRGLGISEDWAVVRQVHGNDVRRVWAPGDAGDADAMWTTKTDLPLAIFTADCYGVVLEAPDAVGVAHAGWRGAASGVVDRLRTEMTRAGHSPKTASVGPGIGPCCFEVGPEVAEKFDSRHVAETTWGTTSIDLPLVVAAQLDGLEPWFSDACTFHEERWLSHRVDATTERMAAIGWLA